MASYFDDHNITETEQAPNEGNLLSALDFFTSLRTQQHTDGSNPLEYIISQLLDESNSNERGPPPASKAFIRKLPNLQPGEMKKGELCSICNEPYLTPTGAQQPCTRLPCTHGFHKECIQPWLELHNTCPMCRHEVHSDDPHWQRLNPDSYVPYDEDSEADLNWMMYG
ncbi:hypothetical protein K493DRAFT_412029 [Basidiobolus meristosporus CBS 931.73]|uniref:RING-type domain-containing protein n=1 Tax=Basidiobolus meristosporus CBS 931.73 TaxID=1314790 RepID=A0A1Y1X5P5_9FUNG|nr:hypothetical protein K493DRAFT_412029 [Basidiobolus meristosporus CBS 931.73]|eukprot:ORX81140.1 hypothetical protein K493DRAFT_412029 [Basidiobolus meristosporus CBS 931.73]